MTVIKEVKKHKKHSNDYLLRIIIESKTLITMSMSKLLLKR
jgi:hypothetical protein